MPPRGDGGRGGQHDLGRLPGGDVELAHRYQVRGDRALDQLQGGVRAAADVQVPEPFGVVAPGMIGPVVVKAPAGFGAGQRRAHRQLGAVADGSDLGAAHQLMRGPGPHPGDLVRHPAEGLGREGQPASVLGGAT